VADTADRVIPTYNWCHGPAGTSQLFAALALAGVDEIAGLPVDAAIRRPRYHEISPGGSGD
jgi:hypothetical protein